MFLAQLLLWGGLTCGGSELCQCALVAFTANSRSHKMSSCGIREASRKHTLLTQIASVQRCRLLAASRQTLSNELFLCP